MATKNKKRRVCFDGKVPVTFALTENDLQRLTQMYQNAYQNFVDGKATAGNWFELGTRCAYCIVLAKKFYSEENYSALQDVFTVIERIRNRFIVEDIWKATPDELEELLMGLDAANDIQTQISRREQILAMKKAIALMNELVNHDKETVVKHA